MKWNIVLTGFISTGKSTVARSLGHRLDLPVMELDEMILDAAGATRAGIFERGGEALFRRYEREQVLKAAAMKGVVISCGGGVVLDTANVSALRGSGVIVLLTASVETIYRRTMHQDDRPIFSGGDRRDVIRRMMEEREPYYRAVADIEVPVDDTSVAGTVETIVGRLKEMGRLEPEH